MNYVRKRQDRESRSVQSAFDFPIALECARCGAADVKTLSELGDVSPDSWLCVSCKVLLKIYNGLRRYRINSDTGEIFEGNKT